MSAQRTTGMVLVGLFVAVLIIPSVAVADEIDEPDDWGDPVFNYSGDGYDPGDLEAAFINYNDVDETIQFRINFTGSAPDNPMSDNVTQIYIDSDTDSATGVNDDTFTSGGDIATFYNNTDNIGADYRVEIGDGTNVIAPWNDGLNGFESSSAESIETNTSADSVVVEFDYSIIEEEPVDTFDLKFVYIDTSGQVEDKTDYTWAPDADDDEINSTRFSTTDGGGGGTVPVATVKANVNLSSNDNLNDDAAIEFTLEGSETTETKTVEGTDTTGSNDVNVTFNVNANEFNDNEESITAELTGGENYTLDEEKQINTDLSDDDQVTKTFETIDLIDITGGVDGLDKESQNINIILKDDGDDPVDTQNIVPDESSKPYEFTDVKATQFTGGGSVQVDLDDTSSNTVSPEERTINTDRYNAEDKTPSNFTVEAPPHVVDLELNESDEVDVRTDNAFNVTVNLASNGDGKDIEGITHVVEFDPAPVDVKAITPLVSAGDDNTTDEAAGEVTVQLTSSSELVAQGGQDDLYNITFELEDDDAVFDPDYNTDQVVSVSTTDQTELVNDSTSPSDAVAYDIDEGQDGEILPLNNTETEIGDVTYTHLTDTGDMVGAPTKFRVDVTTNQGRLANITLKNNNTGSTDVYDCKGSSICEGVVQDTPTKSTFNGTGYSIVSDRYKITIYPENNGDTTVINNPRGAGDKVYNESDVSNLGANGLGNVTVKDVDAVLQNTGAETGELPWDNPVDARYDVNNDGVVDIVDATAVAQDW